MYTSIAQKTFFWLQFSTQWCHYHYSLQSDYLGWSRLASWYNFSNTWPPFDITTPGSIFSYSK